GEGAAAPGQGGGLSRWVPGGSVAVGAVAGLTRDLRGRGAGCPACGNVAAAATAPVAAWSMGSARRRLGTVGESRGRRRHRPTAGVPRWRRPRPLPRSRGAFTTLGALLGLSLGAGLSWWVPVISVAVWLVTVLTPYLLGRGHGYTALGNVAAAVTAPVAAWFL